MPARNERKRPEPGLEPGLEPSLETSADLQSARLEHRIQSLKREANMSPPYRNQILNEIEQLKVKVQALGIKRYPRDYPPSGIR